MQRGGHQQCLVLPSALRVSLGTAQEEEQPASSSGVLPLRCGRSQQEKAVTSCLAAACWRKLPWSYRPLAVWW